MARIGFLGLGNMGLPMAQNLVKAGHEVAGFDPQPAARERLAAAGGRSAASAGEAVAGAELVLTMLPAGAQVRDAYLAPGGILEAAMGSPLLVDCSTIDVESARAVHRAAAEKGLAMIDAPVSGGVAGAAAGSLTFMVGGEPEAFERARPFLELMGKTVVHAGPAGTGQAAKICNNMILGVSMIAVSEAFVLGQKLGLDPERLFAIASRSSGQCWSMTSYCPLPGLVPSSPANREYQPGFTVAMMLKDLRLAQAAAAEVSAATPLGAEACQLYTLFAKDAALLDFSAIIKMLGGENP